MARWWTRWFLPEDLSKLRGGRTRDTKERSDDILVSLLQEETDQKPSKLISQVKKCAMSVSTNCTREEESGMLDTLRSQRGVFTALLPYLWPSQKHAPSHELLLMRATQMKSYVNASQKRSFEEQLDQGE